MPDTNTNPALSPAAEVLQNVESSADALLALREQLKQKNLNTSQLDELRHAMETSMTIKDKVKRDLAEMIDKERGIREAEEKLQRESIQQTPAVPEMIQVPLTPEAKTFSTKLGDTAATITDKVLPERWTTNMSRGQKIMTATAMTLGVGLVGWYALRALFGRGKYAVEEGKEAAEESKGGFWKKLLIGTGIGVAAFLGIDYIFRHYKKEIEDTVRGYMPNFRAPDGLLPDAARPYADVAENAGRAATGAAAGAGSTVIERSTAQVDALKEIPPAVMALLAEGNFAELGRRGWTFLKKEGKWIGENLVNTYAVPADFIEKYLSGEIPDLWQGGWLYGEAGASYVLGRATWQAILTGKIRPPMSVRSLGNATLRIAGWPVMMAFDGAKMIVIPLRADGRAVAKSVFTRWGPLGLIRDFRAEKKALTGTIESTRNAMGYFKYQRNLIASMHRELDGLSRGLVKMESLTALEHSNELLAKNLAKGAEKTRKALLSAGKPVPHWIDELSKITSLSEANLIVEKVDEIKLLMAAEEASSAAASARSVPKPTPTSTPGTIPQPAASASAKPAETADDVLNSSINALRNRYSGDDLLRFDRAREVCKELALTAEQTKAALSDSKVLFVLGQDSRFVDEAMKVAAQSPDPTASMRKVATYIMQLDKQFKPKLLDPAVIKTIIESDAHPSSISRIFRSAQVAGAIEAASTDDLIKAINGMSRWQKMGRVGKGIYAGGVLVEIAALGLDAMALTDGIKRVDETMKALPDSLAKAGFVHKGNFVYQHPSGAIIELEKINQNLADMNNPQIGRVAVDAGGVLTTILAPSFCLGPGGLIVAGVAVTAQAGMTAWEQGKYRDLIRYTPTAILALITAHGATGMSEHEIIADTSNNMISDAFRGTQAENEKERKLIRRKMLATIFGREMISAYPALGQEILSQTADSKEKSLDLVTFLDDNGDFLKDGGGFDTIVGPYLSERLFDLSNDNNVRWKDFAEHKIDGGWFDATNVSADDLNLAVRESVVLYAEHVRELRYHSLMKPRQMDASGKTIEEQAKAELSQIIREENQKTAGEEVVLGRKLSEIPDGKETRVQNYIASLYERLNRVSERGVKETQTYMPSRAGGHYVTDIHYATKAEMGGSGQMVFVIENGDLPGKDSDQLTMEQFMQEIMHTDTNVDQLKDPVEWNGVKIFNRFAVRRNADGTYAYNAENKNFAPLTFRFVPQKGWQWSKDKQTWISQVDTRVFAGGRRSLYNSELTKPNADFFFALNKQSA